MPINVQTTDIIETTGNCLTYARSETWVVAESAILVSDTGSGVESVHDGSGLHNRGGIASQSGVAVKMTGLGNLVINDVSGAIVGATALLVGEGTTVINDGLIRSNRPGAEAIRASGDLHLTNTGALVGDVLSRTDAGDEVHNAGSIFGDVLLGKGGDLYDGRGGLLHGAVQGSGGADTLIGGDHDDTLLGGAGQDLIRGGRGDDEIDGGDGRDTLMGGDGADSFVFADPGKADRIIDFAAGDRIHLDNAAWAGLGGEGALEASAFHFGGQAADADHRLLYDTVTGALKHDENGDAAGGVTLIARLDPGLDLGHHAFEIV